MNRRVSEALNQAEQEDNLPVQWGPTDFQNGFEQGQDSDKILLSDLNNYPNWMKPWVLGAQDFATMMRSMPYVMDVTGSALATTPAPAYDDPMEAYLSRPNAALGTESAVYKIKDDEGNYLTPDSPFVRQLEEQKLGQLQGDFRTSMRRYEDFLAKEKAYQDAINLETPGQDFLQSMGFGDGTFSPTDMATHVYQQVARMAPSIAGIGLTSGVAGPAAGMANYGMFGLLGANQGVMDAMGEKWWDDLSPEGKLGYMTAYGALEALPEWMGGRIATRAAKKFINKEITEEVFQKTTNEILTGMGKAAGIDFALEGGTEALTGAGQSILQDVAQGKPADLQKAFRSAAEGFFLGGFSGVAFGTPGYVGDGVALANSIATDAQVYKAKADVKKFQNLLANATTDAEKYAYAEQLKDAMDRRMQRTKIKRDLYQYVGQNAPEDLQQMIDLDRKMQTAMRMSLSVADPETRKKYAEEFKGLKEQFSQLEQKHAKAFATDSKKRGTTTQSVRQDKQIPFGYTSQQWNQQAKTEDQKSLGRSVDLAERVLGPESGISFVIHDGTFGDAMNRFAKDGAQEGESGRLIVNQENGNIEIHLDSKTADRATVAHELFHAVFLQQFKQDESTAARMADALQSGMKNASKEDQLIMRKALDFAASYNQNLKPEEFLAEFGGVLAASYKQLSPSGRKTFINKLVEVLDELLKAVGINMGSLAKMRETFKNEQDVINFMNRFSEAFNSGAPLQVTTAEQVETIDPAVVQERQRFINEELAKRSSSTQVGSTEGSYIKAAMALKDLGVEGDILDYGAGFGKGTTAMSQVFGRKVDDFEPFPERRAQQDPPLPEPTFSNASDINKTYDGIVSLNVLNVVPPNVRDAIVSDIYDKLNPGGYAIIGTRGYRDDIARTKKFTPAEEQGAIYVEKADGPVYQKGFDGSELQEYVAALVPNADVARVASGKWGKSGIIMRKPMATERSQIRTAANQDDLYSIYEDFFNMSPDQADAAAEVSSLIIASMADRAGVSVAEMYKGITWTNGFVVNPDNALFQEEIRAANETAQVYSNIMDSLRKMPENTPKQMPAQWVSSIQKFGVRGTQTELDAINLKGSLEAFAEQEGVKTLTRDQVMSVAGTLSIPVHIPYTEGYADSYLGQLPVGLEYSRSQGPSRGAEALVNATTVLLNSMYLNRPAVRPHFDRYNHPYFDVPFPRYNPDGNYSRQSDPSGRLPSENFGTNIAHMRASIVKDTRQGKEIYHVNEMQSDLIQNVRQGSGVEFAQTQSVGQESDAAYADRIHSAILSILNSENSNGDLNGQAIQDAITNYSLRRNLSPQQIAQLSAQYLSESYSLEDYIRQVNVSIRNIVNKFNPSTDPSYAQSVQSLLPDRNNIYNLLPAFVDEGLSGILDDRAAQINLFAGDLNSTESGVGRSQPIESFGPALEATLSYLKTLHAWEMRAIKPEMDYLNTQRSILNSLTNYLTTGEDSELARVSNEEANLLSRTMVSSLVSDNFIESLIANKNLGRSEEQINKAIEDFVERAFQPLQTDGLNALYKVPYRMMWEVMDRIFESVNEPNKLASLGVEPSNFLDPEFMEGRESASEVLQSAKKEMVELIKRNMLLPKSSLRANVLANDSGALSELFLKNEDPVLGFLIKDFLNTIYNPVRHGRGSSAYSTRGRNMMGIYSHPDSTKLIENVIEKINIYKSGVGDGYLYEFERPAQSIGVSKDGLMNLVTDLLTVFSRSPYYANTRKLEGLDTMYPGTLSAVHALLDRKVPGNGAMYPAKVFSIQANNIVGTYLGAQADEYEALASDAMDNLNASRKRFQDVNLLQRRKETTDAVYGREFSSLLGPNITFVDEAMNIAMSSMHNPRIDFREAAKERIDKILANKYGNPFFTVTGVNDPFDYAFVEAYGEPVNQGNSINLLSLLTQQPTDETMKLWLMVVNGHGWNATEISQTSGYDHTLLTPAFSVLQAMGTGSLHQKSEPSALARKIDEVITDIAFDRYEQELSPTLHHLTRGLIEAANAKLPSVWESVNNLSTKENGADIDIRTSGESFQSRVADGVSAMRAAQITREDFVDGPRDEGQTYANVILNAQSEVSNAFKNSNINAHSNWLTYVLGAVDRSNKEKLSTKDLDKLTFLDYSFYTALDKFFEYSIQEIYSRPDTPSIAHAKDQAAFEFGEFILNYLQRDLGTFIPTYSMSEATQRMAAHFESIFEDSTFPGRSPVINKLLNNYNETVGDAGPSLWEGALAALVQAVRGMTPIVSQMNSSLMLVGSYGDQPIFDNTLQWAKMSGVNLEQAKAAYRNNVIGLGNYAKNLILGSHKTFQKYIGSLANRTVSDDRVTANEAMNEVFYANRVAQKISDYLNGVDDPNLLPEVDVPPIFKEEVYEDGWTQGGELIGTIDEDTDGLRSLIQPPNSPYKNSAQFGAALVRTAIREAYMQGLTEVRVNSGVAIEAAVGGGQGNINWYNDVLPKIAKKEIQRWDKSADITFHTGAYKDPMRGSNPGEGTYTGFSFPITETMINNLLDSEGRIPLYQDNRGAMVRQEASVTIHALTNADVTTPLHELAHVFEDYLTSEERNSVLRWAGHKQWSRNTSEEFAKGFEQYLKNGKAPTASLKSIFAKFAEWLKKLYGAIMRTNKPLNSKMEAIYADMLTPNERSEIKERSRYIPPDATADEMAQYEGFARRKRRSAGPKVITKTTPKPAFKPTKLPEPKQLSLFDIQEAQDNVDNAINGATGTINERSRRVAPVKIQHNRVRPGLKLPAKFTSAKPISPSKLAGSTVVTTPSDRMAVGEYTHAPGIKSDWKGGYGYPALMNLPWASSSKAALNKWMSIVNKEVEKNGVAYLAPVIMARETHTSNFQYFLAGINEIKAALKKKRATEEDVREKLEKISGMPIPGGNLIDLSAALKEKNIYKVLDKISQMHSVENATFPQRKEFMNRLLGAPNFQAANPKPGIPGVITGTELTRITTMPSLEDVPRGFIPGVVKITAPLKPRETTVKEDGFEFHESYPWTAELTQPNSVEWIPFTEAIHASDLGDVRSPSGQSVNWNAIEQEQDNIDKALMTFHTRIGLANAAFSVMGEVRHNRDIESSVGERSRKLPPALNEAIGGSFVDGTPIDPFNMALISITEKLVDKYFRLDVVQRGVVARRKARGEGGVDLDQDVMNALTLMDSKASNKIQEFGKTQDELIKLIEASGKTIEDLADLLYALHATETNAYVYNLTNGDKESGSGMTNQEAAKILEEYGLNSSMDMKTVLKTLPENIRKPIKMIYDILAQNRKNLMDYGLMSGAETLENKNGKYQIVSAVDGSVIAEFNDFTEANKVYQARIEWARKYEFYVPLRGLAPDQIVDVNGNPIDADIPMPGPSSATGSGLQGGKRPPFKSRKGRYTKAFNPIAQTLEMYYTTIINGEKNLALQRLYNLLENEPMESQWELARYDAVVGYNTRKGPKGKLVRVTQTAREMRNDPKVSVVRINGDDHYIIWKGDNAQEIAASVNGSNTLQGNGFTRFLGHLNRYMSSTITMLDPEFIVRNFARDIQAAFINIAGMETEMGDPVNTSEIMSETMDMVLPALLAIRSEEVATKPRFASKLMRNLRTPASRQKFKRNQDRALQYYQEFKEEGAKTGWFHAPNAEELAKLMADALPNNNQYSAIEKGAQYAKDAGAAFLKLVEGYNTSVENAIRLASYISAREAGVSKEKAAELAKNLTVNFNRSGAYGSVLNSMYLFFNASVQGSLTVFRVLARNPVRTDMTTGDKSFKLTGAQKVAIGSFMLGMINAMLNQLVFSDDDDDDRTSWEKQPDYLKQTNMVIMSGKNSFKVPLPYGFNVFYAMGVGMMDAALGVREISSLPSYMASTLSGSFLPVNAPNSDKFFNTILKMGMPSAFNWLVSLGLNEDYFGNTIYPAENPFEKGIVVSSQQGYPTTSAPAKAVAEAVNWMTGGNKYRPGRMDFAPQAYDYIFEYWTGGVGKFATRSATVLELATKGQWEDIEARKIPFARVFYGGETAFADFDEYEKNKKVVYSLMKRPRSEFEVGEGPRVLRVNNLLRTTEKDLKNVSSQLKTLYAQPESLQTSAKIKQWMERRQRLHQNFIKAYRQNDIQDIY